MGLTLVGLGLADCEDVTLKGYNATKAAEFVYLETYTSCLMVAKEQLEKFYGKTIIEADRYMIEQQCEEMLKRSETADVVLLVVGDPFCATTHSDIALRARNRGIAVKIIHNASIMSAVASSGLQMYRFGETVSIPFFDGSWKPDSFYEKLKANRSSDLHTLCLLDIKVKEQSFENLMRGKQIFEPPRFMSIQQAVAQLLEIEEKRGEQVCCPDTFGFGLARMGSETECIASGTLQELMEREFGDPLHSLIICGPTLHDIEKEFFDVHHI